MLRPLAAPFTRPAVRWLSSTPLWRGNNQNSGNDIQGSGTYSGVNLTSGDPLLAPLGDYGGPTPTRPPLPGSPAIDAATNGMGFTIDQRGLPRVNGFNVDLGAVEFPFGDVAWWR